MNKKRGYFFTLDAMLSIGVLVIGIFLILTYTSKIPSKTQTSLLSEDILDFLSKTKIKDLNSKYAGIGGELWNNGEITNSDNTLLQQIGEFYYYGRLETAEKFLLNVSTPVVPFQYKLEFWIDGNLVHPLEPSPEHLSSKSKTKILLPSRTIVYGALNKTADLFGPYKVEVFVWE